MFFPATESALKEAEYRIKACTQKAVELIGSYSSVGIEQAVFVYLMENFERLPFGFFPVRENIHTSVRPDELFDPKEDRHKDSMIADEFSAAFKKIGDERDIPMLEDTLEAAGAEAMSEEQADEFNKQQMENYCPDCHRGVIVNYQKDCECIAIVQTGSADAPFGRCSYCKKCRGSGHESITCPKCGGDGLSEKGKNDPDYNQNLAQQKLDEMGFPKNLIPKVGPYADRYIDSEIVCISKWELGAIQAGPKDKDKFKMFAVKQLVRELSMFFFNDFSQEGYGVPGNSLDAPKTDEFRELNTLYSYLLCIYLRIQSKRLLGMFVLSDPEYFKDVFIEHQEEAKKFLSEIVSEIKNPTITMGI